ncbi:MAG TPA: chemotaxis protein CheB [Gemmataceae bacterium]|nr:chemotaxis protein CheB [Gemmataceae bacterium]
MSSADPAESPLAPDSPDDQPPAVPLLVVGVGGSAGGLEAFREVLESLPAEGNMAFLFVQHLPPDHRSLLPELLARVTPMTVVQAEQGMQIEADHLYLIPPDADMAVQGGEIVLTPRAARTAVHMPIDHLFRSLAEDQRGRSVGVVLSGGGTDGTLGLKVIKAEGGITFAQDEKSARHDSMPRSAITDGWVDYVLPPAEIARQLLRISRHPYTVNHEAVVAPEADGMVDRILGVLRGHFGVDFTQYKRTTITRRIRRRMALRGLEASADYLRLLQEDGAEKQNLYQDLLISVTRFFRDEEIFEALKKTVFPALVKERSPNSPIRIWTAGCSTGEEVYSLAIALLEFLGDRVVSFPIKILATDVNEQALERARAGLYVDNIELDVSAERLRRFFAKVDGHYQIGKVVRDLCIFSRHNLTTDPPFSRLDLVSCRNVLIYLDVPLQKRVLPLLYYSLNPGGFLLLGASETVGSYTDLFTAVDQGRRIFSRNVGATAPLPPDVGLHIDTNLPALRLGPVGPHATWNALDVQREADRVVLSRYAPVGVVVDEAMTVLQFRGRTGPFLEAAPGTASLDLMKMLREGLLSEVRAAVGRGRAEGVAVHREGIPVRDGAGFRMVDLDVLPIKVPPAGVRCFLVLFQDAPVPPPPAETSPADDARHAKSEEQIHQLQQELAATREYMQSLLEEHESASEELKSASEELLSSNEELQSTNEELQTAKEETQSANEELATLNDELQHRNLELAQVNNDLVNLFGAVQIAIVLVGRDLRIRRFTPSAEKALNLIPSDVGRPISDIRPNLAIADLAGMITRVIDSLTPVESQIQDRDGRWHVLRIRPYVTLDNKIDGASIILLDIDAVVRKGAAAPPPAPDAGNGPGAGESARPVQEDEPTEAPR